MIGLPTQTVALDFAANAAEFAVNWFLQSTLLILAGLAVGALLRRHGSAVQSVVYCTTLAAALVCPLATWGLSLMGVPGWSVKLPSAWSEAPVAAAATAEQSPAETPLVASASDVAESLPTQAPPDKVYSAVDPSWQPSMGVGERSPSPVSELPDVAVAESSPTVAPVVDPVAEAPPAERTETRVIIHRYGAAVLIGAAVWLVVAAGLGVRLAAAWRRLAHLRRRAAPADDQARAACHTLASRMEVSTPDVLYSPFLPSPCLAGINQPAVLLPDETLNLSLHDVLIHELAHLKRRDCHWNLLRQLATSLFFFQPLLWVLSRRIETTAEEVCDDFVVQFGGDRHAYAHRLVDLAELSTAPMAAAGVGIVSLRSMLARRVARVLDTSRSLSTRVGNLLLAVVIVGGLLGVTFAGFLGLEPKASDAKSAVAERDVVTDETTTDDDGALDEQAEGAGEEEPDATTTIEGRVLDPAGRAVAGATVVAQRWIHDPEEPKTPIAETKSGGDGRFEISFPKQDDATIVAAAEGFGAAFVRQEAIEPDREPTLQLVKDDAPIKGRVVDLEGNPLAGVTVQIGGVAATEDEDLDPWLKAIAQGQILWEANNHYFSGRTPQNPPHVPDSVTTDSDGAFTIRGIGRERQFRIALTGPTIAHTRATVVTREMESVVAKDGMPDPDWSRQHTIYGANCQIVAAPTQPIEGVVRDAETGQPLAGVAVESYRMAPRGLSGARLIRTDSDDQGRFRLVGMPKGPGKQIIAVPGDDLPYLMREFDVPEQPGIEPVEMELELHRGVWISGQVTDKATGEPVGNPRSSFAYYYAYRSNPYAQALPEFDD
ncbi:MAG: M56 family metallopeptidase, partial [Planctomycetota bacterium]